MRLNFITLNNLIVVDILSRFKNTVPIIELLSQNK